MLGIEINDVKLSFKRRCYWTVHDFLNIFENVIEMLSFQYLHVSFTHYWWENFHERTFANYN